MRLMQIRRIFTKGGEGKQSVLELAIYGICGKFTDSTGNTEAKKFLVSVDIAPFTPDEGLYLWLGPTEGLAPRLTS